MCNRFVSCALVLLAVATSGCATIMHGTTQEIAILSAPSGAQVSVDSAAVGRTPLRLLLKRKQAHQVRIETAGYQRYQATVARHVSGWAWGDVFGAVIPLVGLPVDLSTGGLYNLEPDRILASLTPSWDTLSPRDRPAGAGAAAGVRVVGRLERAVMVGSRVRAGGPGGSSVLEGIVTAVRGDTLELMTAGSLVPFVLPLDEVGRLELGVGRKGHGAIGAAVGLVAGFGLGWVIGSVGYQPCESSGGLFDMSCLMAPESRADAATLTAALGGAGGILAGLLIGAAITTERWELVPLSSLRVGLAPLPAGRLGLGAAFRF